MNDKLHIVLCEAREANDDQRALERELAARLSDDGRVDLAVLPHLYDITPDGVAVQYLRSLPGDLLLLGWLYPRAAYWVLRANGISGRMGRTSLFPEEETEASDATDGRTVWCIDLREHRKVGTVAPEIERIIKGRQQPAAARPRPEVAARIEEAIEPRWYPVVDYDRCVNCLECLNFCLFGVYGLDEQGRILVEEPDACRDGCPACSRVCPSTAIMFPEYADVQIAGGQPPLSETEPPGDSLAQKQAEAERRQALLNQQPETQSVGDLDRLVDELDDSNL